MNKMKCEKCGKELYGKLILMSGRFILDTNIVIAIFNGETSIKEHLLKADEVFISSTVLGELFFGAFKSKRSKTNLKRISVWNCEK
jgi:predicted nucleic acid-binding protein